MSSEVQFDEDSFSRASKASRPGMGGSGSKGEPKIVQWIMNHGLAKTPSMANGILIALILVNSIITYLVIHFFF